MIPGTEQVSTDDLRLGDMVWFEGQRRHAWAMIVATYFHLATLRPSEGITVVFDDGTEEHRKPAPDEMWTRTPALMGGFRPQDIARGIEHAEKTVRGLQQKIGRLRRLQGLVDAVTAARG